MGKGSLLQFLFFASHSVRARPLYKGSRPERATSGLRPGDGQSNPLVLQGLRGLLLTVPDRLAVLDGSSPGNRGDLSGFLGDFAGLTFTVVVVTHD